MSRLIIGVDMDGCLADFNGSYMELLKKQTRKDLFPEGKTAENYPTEWYYDKAAGYTVNEINAAWKYIQEDSVDFWENLDVLDDSVVPALDELNRLVDLDLADVYFITHRSGREAKIQTETWLTKFHVDNPTVLLSGVKAPVVAGLGLTHFIDDKVETILEVDAWVAGTKTFLKNAPYNTNQAVPTRVTRVETVLEALRTIYGK